ncbi:MAG: hypothetical protein M1824_002492 [Vezdaea acicularis]|nr:MAG: hypothetical protein M1824_002492 [Vezdaea acicularis]
MSTTGWEWDPEKQLSYRTELDKYGRPQRKYYMTQPQSQYSPNYPRYLPESTTKGVDSTYGTSDTQGPYNSTYGTYPGNQDTRNNPSYGGNVYGYQQDATGQAAQYIDQPSTTAPYEDYQSESAVPNQQGVGEASAGIDYSQDIRYNTRYQPNTYYEQIPQNPPTSQDAHRVASSQLYVPPEDTEIKNVAYGTESRDGGGSSRRRKSSSSTTRSNGAKKDGSYAMTNIVEKFGQMTTNPETVFENEYVNEDTRPSRNSRSRRKNTSTRGGQKNESAEGGTIPGARRIRGTDGAEKPLDPSYKLQDKSLFAVGNIISCLWSEPAGTQPPSAKTVAELDNVLLYTTKYGEKVYSTIRRFVVVKERNMCCYCLPICTYGGNGTSRKGMDAKLHAIIYMSGTQPTAVKGEPRINNEPIEVGIYPNEASLKYASRLNYGKLYTIEHNVKMKVVGYVAELSVPKVVRTWERLILE